MTRRGWQAIAARGKRRRALAFKREGERGQLVRDVQRARIQAQHWETRAKEWADAEVITVPAERYVQVSFRIDRAAIRLDRERAIARAFSYATEQFARVK